MCSLNNTQELGFRTYGKMGKVEKEIENHLRFCSCDVILRQSPLITVLVVFFPDFNSIELQYKTKNANVKFIPKQEICHLKFLLPLFNTVGCIVIYAVCDFKGGLQRPTSPPEDNRGPQNAVEGKMEGEKNLINILDQCHKIKTVFHHLFLFFLFFI